MSGILRRLDKKVAENGKSGKVLPSAEAIRELRERLKDKDNKTLGFRVHTGFHAILKIVSKKMGVTEGALIEALLLKAFREVRDRVDEVELEYYEREFGLKRLLSEVEDLLDKL